MFGQKVTNICLNPINNVFADRISKSHFSWSDKMLIYLGISIFWGLIEFTGLCLAKSYIFRFNFCNYLLVVNYFFLFVTFTQGFIVLWVSLN
jgi:hypothetical protein